MKPTIDMEVFENLSGVEAIKSFIDSISDMGILITDMNGYIVFFNSAASYYDRIDRKTAIGMHFKNLYKDDDGGIIQKVMKEKHPVLNAIASYKYDDGMSMTSIDSSYPIYVKGEMKYVLTFTRYNNTPSLESLKRIFEISTHSKKNREKKMHNEDGHNTRFTFDKILGDSKPMRDTVQKAVRAAKSFAPVFLEGETGTGKEMFAQSIHASSDRADKPFVAINCAAIPENLLESTLFGTTKGSFTGAENKPGLFEQAKDGTFFLDEINSMPLFLQAKLLRVIQEHKVRRIGANYEININCRIITSCNKNVSECINDGDLRNDLYYRLSVIKIEIPSLRTRKEDIKVCVDKFINKYSELYNVIVPGYTDEYIEALKSYNWPGNVRELEHLIESSIVMLPEKRSLSLIDLPRNIMSHYRNDEIDPTKNKSQPEIHFYEYNLNDHLQSSDISNDFDTETALQKSEISENSGDSIQNYLQNKERELLIQILEQNNWNITRTAKALNMNRSNLQYRMRKFNIKRPQNNY